MEQKERLEIMSSIIVETMIENYKQYGSMNSMAETDIEKLIGDNIQGVTQMANLVSERIDAKLFQ